MTSTFEQLKKSRGLAGIEKITKTLENQSKSSFQEDTRFWKPTLDKAGNGSAIIRFLPAPPGEDDHWVKLLTFAFKGPTGSWYIENSRKTLNYTEQDPAAEYVKKLYASNIEANKQLAGKQKSKTNYISNILVVKDPGNPANEGKVFLYKFGKKIFDKIADVTAPESDELETKEPINPFDLWEGANFRLKVRKVDGFPNYDKSEFLDRSVAVEGASDDELKKLWESEYSLKALVDPKEFKPYEVLLEKFNRVMGFGDTTPTPRSAGVSTKTRVETEIEKAEDNEELSNLTVDDDESDLGFLQKVAADLSDD